ncbi:MAG TPA: DegQ family serine endoprotease [Acidobacteriota bacterium]|nr:DegQ family serine endoprotease [Acidobacteriota bacterium]
MKSNTIYGSLILIAMILLIAWSPFHTTASTSPVAPSGSNLPYQAIQKPAVSPINAAKQMSAAFIEVSKKVTPSIVMIVNEEKFQSEFPNDQPGDDFFQRFFNFDPRQQQSVQKTLGSGVIVREDGYIMTNNHVVDNSTKLQVTLPDGDRLPAKIIGKDPKTDLALIKVDRKGLKPISLGNYDSIEVGEWVLAIGTPFAEALHHTVTAGIVSAKGRSNVGIADYEDFLQTDAAINPGNSGGALVDLDGNLIGINTAIASTNGGSSGVGFAIPINMVQNVMQQLIKNGHVIRGYMGATIQDLTPEMRKSLGLANSLQGAVVSGVEKGSPADKAGLKSYDVVTAVQGKPVTSQMELRETIASFAPGSTADLTVLRNGKPETVTIQIKEMPGNLAANRQDSGQSQQLGLDVQELTPRIAKELGTQAESGVVVSRVAPGSIAEEAGLQRGDVIFEINRQKVSSLDDFNRLIQGSKDNALLVAVDRQGSSFFVTIQSN